jgi:hypothetical protein
LKETRDPQSYDITSGPRACHGGKNEQRQKSYFIEEVPEAEVPEAEEKPLKRIIASPTERSPSQAQDLYYFVDPSTNEKWQRSYHRQRRSHVQRTYWRNRTQASESSVAASLRTGLLVTADRQRVIESLSCSMSDTLCGQGYGDLKVATIANLIETCKNLFML